MDRTAQNVVPISAKPVAFWSYSWALVREAHKVSRERWAGLGQWVGEIAGALALLNAFGVVDWLQNWAGDELRAWVKPVSAVLVVGIFLYGVLRVAHRREMALQGTLGEVLSELTFDCQINGLYIAVVSPEQWHLFVLATVRNRSKLASTLENWRIAVRYPNEPEHLLQKFKIKPALPITLPGFATISSEETIEDLTFPTAVRAGDAKRGWLPAILDSYPPANTEYRVSCQDNRGTVYTGSFIGTATPGGPTPLLHYPGVTLAPPVTPPASHTEPHRS